MRTNEFIEDNLIIIPILILFFLITVYGMVYHNQRSKMNDKKELFAACVVSGGKPELCLAALRKE